MKEASGTQKQQVTLWDGKACLTCRKALSGPAGFFSSFGYQSWTSRLRSKVYLLPSSRTTFICTECLNIVSKVYFNKEFYL